MIEWKQLQRLAMEVRQAIGIERTPQQLREWLQANVRRPENLIRAAFSEQDILLDLANRLRIPYLDNSPSSAEWI